MKHYNVLYNCIFQGLLRNYPPQKESHEAPLKDQNYMFNFIHKKKDMKLVVSDKHNFGVIERLLRFTLTTR